MSRFVALCLVLLLAAAARAEDEAGDFDYYVLSLSWSPNWCLLEGDARNSPQCAAERDFGWVLHGLWPQYERGWPQDCFSPHAPPSRHMTEGMADIMGTSGLAWHQWRKHGACTGLPPAEYYALSRLAYETVTRPEVFSRLTRPVTLPAAVVEQAFTRENAGLDPNEITVTCRSGLIQEVRICLTRDLEFRRCGADVARDCSLDDARMDPVR